MRALSLTQPWAILVAIGAKKIETRSWPTRYRGLIAIHAAKGFPVRAQDYCRDEPFLSVLEEAGFTKFSQIPRGEIVAVAELKNVCRTEEIIVSISEQERAFGNYAPGRWAWMLANVRALSEPIPCRGALQLWTLPPELLARVQRELA